MGLDITIDKVVTVKCPDCGHEIHGVRDNICYWRGDRDLLSYIEDNIHSYKGNDIGTDVELTIDDLYKVQLFLMRRALRMDMYSYEFDDEYDPADDTYSIKRIDDLIESMKYGDYNIKPENIKVIYNASW